nr:hypothetical protein [Tanacetum cinerariifolium]
MQYVVEDVGEDADFNSGAWGGTVTGCLGDIDNFLKKEKLEQVIAIVKSCSPNALRDLNVTLKDLSGTVPGTINYKVLNVGSYGKNIIVGAAMILANVSVFTHKPSKHYINITKRNVVEVFRKDTVLESARQNYYKCGFFLWKEERVGLLINSPGSSSTTTFSQGTSSTPSFSPTLSTPPIYYEGSSSNTECSNCNHLLGRIKAGYGRVMPSNVPMMCWSVGKNDFHINDSLQLQNEPHFSNPESSFAFRSNEYNTDDVVNENPQKKFHKWQKFMSFEPDILETPVYKAKPNISKQYTQQFEVEKGNIFDNKEALILAVRLKALNEGLQFLTD